jgi:hypothetical protein
MKPFFNNDPMPSEKNTSQTASKAWLLRNGNQPYNLGHTKRCGASTRAGGACLQPAMANGRCRLHGGLSTGAKTAEGKVRQQASVFKHGEYTKASKQRSREVRELMRHCKRSLEDWRL